MGNSFTDPPAGEPVSTAFGWFRSLGIEEIRSRYNEFGDRSTVAVLDTGIDTKNPEIPPPVSARVFLPASLSGITIQDYLGHGTFCTSLIATNSPGFNLGIAPRCRTLTGKVSHAGEFPDFTLLLDAIEWAILSGADIISISLGAKINDPQKVVEIQSRFTSLTRKKNVIILAASGDSHSEEVITADFYPASFENCISVGTSFQNDIHFITVRSKKTILHAPGIDIEGYGLNNEIVTLSGTSMSTPIVAGVLALGVSMTKKRNKGTWNSAQLTEKLIATGTPILSVPGKITINPKAFFESI